MSYKAVDLNDLNETKKRFEKKGFFNSFKIDDNQKKQIRILPGCYGSSETLPFLPIEQHWAPPAVHKGPLLCPNKHLTEDGELLEDACSWCARVSELYAEEKEISKIEKELPEQDPQREELKLRRKIISAKLYKLRIERKFFFMVIDRTTGDVVELGATKGLFDQILNYIQSSPSMLDPYEGNDVFVEKKVTPLPNSTRKKIEYNLSPAFEKSPLHTQPSETEDILTKVLDEAPLKRHLKEAPDPALMDSLLPKLEAWVEADTKGKWDTQSQVSQPSRAAAAAMNYTPQPQQQEATQYVQQAPPAPVQQAPQPVQQPAAQVPQPAPAQATADAQFTPPAGATTLAADNIPMEYESKEEAADNAELLESLSALPSD